MHEEWEDYDRKQFLAWWAENTASQIKEIACSVPVQPRRMCCKLLLGEKDMKIRICKMKPFHAKPTVVMDICLYGAEINTFSLVSGLQFAFSFFSIPIYPFTIGNRMQFPTISFKVHAINVSVFRLFACYCRCGAEQEVKWVKKTGDKETQAICQNLLHVEGMLSFSILMQATQLLCVPQQGSNREMEHKYWNFCEVSTLAVKFSVAEICPHSFSSGKPLYVCLSSTEVNGISVQA